MGDEGRNPVLSLSIGNVMWEKSFLRKFEASRSQIRNKRAKAKKLNLYVKKGTFFVLCNTVVVIRTLSI